MTAGENDRIRRFRARPGHWRHGLFSVQVLPGIQYPEIVEWNAPRAHSSYVLPDGAIKEVAMPAPEPPASPAESSTQEG